jgi:hypothetical protein
VHAVFLLNFMPWQDKLTVFDNAVFPAPNARNAWPRDVMLYPRRKSWVTGRAGFPVLGYRLWLSVATCGASK